MQDDNNTENVPDESLPVTEAETPVQSNESPFVNNMPMQKKPSNKKMLIIVGIAVLVLSLGALAYAAVSGGWFNSKSDSSAKDKDANLDAESLVIKDKDDLKTAKTILNKTVTKPTEEEKKLEEQK